MEMKYNGVRIYCLPDDNFCLKDEEHRSPLELDECPLGEDVCTGDCFYYLEDSEERRCVFLLDEVDAISCNRSKGMSDVASKEIGRVTITLMQEFDRLPNDVIVLGATNRLDILDEAFISRFPVKKEMLPFSEQESKAMVKKFLADIGYVFSEEEIMGAIRKTQNQREVMNRVVQVLAEKIAGGYDGE